MILKGTEKLSESKSLQNFRPNGLFQGLGKIKVIDKIGRGSPLRICFGPQNLGAFEKLAKLAVSSLQRGQRTYSF